MSSILWLYDSFGEDLWTGGGITAKAVAQELAGMDKSAPIAVRINSPGGDVFEALAVYNLLATDSREISVHIDGLAASAASFVSMAGRRVYMAESAFFMIHPPATLVWGTAEDMRKTAGLLDQVDQSIQGIYTSRRPKLDPEAVAKWKAEETWWNGREALEAGWIDEVVPNAADPDVVDRRQKTQDRISKLVAAQVRCGAWRRAPERVEMLPREILARARMRRMAEA